MTPLAAWLDRLRVWRARRLLASGLRERRQKGTALLSGGPRAQALPLLTQALADDHPLVRAAAAEALAALKDREALPALLDALEEAIGNFYLSTALWEAAQAVAGEESGFDFNKPEEAQRQRIAAWRKK